MSVKKDPDGRRSVQIEVEVPGTPEEVWAAIATGAGVSSWFVPTRVETGPDGQPARVIANFGPGMESISTVTSWNPPHSFSADSADLGPQAPIVATQWFVESRAGGVCVVRVVHSLFASGDDWDDQLLGWENGWPGFFRLLRLYLSHFRGQPCSAFQLLGMAPEPRERAWQAWTEALGIASPGVGQHVRTLAAGPLLAGRVEHVGPKSDPEALLRLDEPAPGIAHLFAMSMGGQVVLSMRCYLFGDGAATAVSTHEPVWRSWMSEHFPLVGEPGHC